MKCRPKKMYYVTVRKTITSDGGWRNYIATPRINEARFYAKKLPLRCRQIDVRELGKKTYVLKDSWL